MEITFDPRAKMNPELNGKRFDFFKVRPHEWTLLGPARFPFADDRRPAKLACAPGGLCGFVLRVLPRQRPADRRARSYVTAWHNHKPLPDWRSTPNFLSAAARTPMPARRGIFQCPSCRPICKRSGLFHLSSRSIPDSPPPIANASPISIACRR